MFSWFHRLSFRVLLKVVWHKGVFAKAMERAHMGANVSKRKLTPEQRKIYRGLAHVSKYHGL